VLVFGLFFVIFLVFFSIALPPWKRHNSAIFWYFFAGPPENFSVDALDTGS